MKVMEKFGCPEYKIMDEEIRNDVKYYRSIVIDKFNALAKKYNDDLNVLIPVEVVDLNASDNRSITKSHSPNQVDCFCFDNNPKKDAVKLPCCQKTMHVTCLGLLLENSTLCPFCRSLLDRMKLLPNATLFRVRMDSSKDEDAGSSKKKEDDASPKETEAKSNLGEPASTRLSDAARDIAMNNKRKHQKQQHERMLRMRKDDMLSREISPGAVVTVRVGSKVVSHSKGIIGVVGDFNEDSGGVRVICESGLIDYWIPFDEYVVRAKAQDLFPLPPEMNKVRADVISGDINLEEYPTVSLPKAHQEVVGASSPCLKKACRCTGGKCVGTCGCKRARRHCHSGCSCNGNCKLSVPDRNEE